MNRQVIITGDGSHSIEIPEWQVTYHSKYGAIQESLHVFIEAGLKVLPKQKPAIPVFEMGFGTGLNALLTLIEAEKNKQSVYYETIEKFPLEERFISSLNYCTQLKKPELQTVFEKLHYCKWNEPITINPGFVFRKIKMDLTVYSFHQSFDLIYYDAFDPKFQPELWTTSIFEKLFQKLEPGGILITYCARGDVRRAMMATGFNVYKLPGPMGKREIIRAIKPL
jgi:tRNA U34 5-methylaminomethyl-2-thiouridine-forming methyltransferase MnmC